MSTTVRTELESALGLLSMEAVNQLWKLDLEYADAVRGGNPIDTIESKKQEVRAELAEQVLENIDSDPKTPTELMRELVANQLWTQVTVHQSQKIGFFPDPGYRAFYEADKIFDIVIDRWKKREALLLDASSSDPVQSAS